MVLAIAAQTSVTHKLPNTKSALADSQRIVSLHVDGKTKIIPTTAPTVDELLKRAGIKLEEGDLVEPAAGVTIPPGSFNINVYRARSIVVQDGVRVVQGRSAYINPKLAIQHLGIELFPEDLVRTQPVTDFLGLGSVGQTFIITRAKPFSVTADGTTRTFRSHMATIAEGLAAAGISLGPDDKVTPALGAELDIGSRITVTRISDSKVTETEVIKRGIKKVMDIDLAAGHQQVRQAGHDGQRQSVYAVHYENGREVSRKLVSSKITKNPHTQVIAIGTKITDDVWYRLRLCESGNNYGSRSNPTYRGAYQISISTWGGYGGYSDPADAPASVQDAKARALQAASGWHPWPACASSLGLL